MYGARTPANLKSSSVLRERAIGVPDPLRLRGTPAAQHPKASLQATCSRTRNTRGSSSRSILRRNSRSTLWRKTSRERFCGSLKRTFATTGSLSRAIAKHRTSTRGPNPICSIARRKNARIPQQTALPHRPATHRRQPATHPNRQTTRRRQLTEHLHWPAARRHRPAAHQSQPAAHLHWPTALRRRSSRRATSSSSASTLTRCQTATAKRARTSPYAKFCPQWSDGERIGAVRGSSLRISWPRP